MGDTKWTKAQNAAINLRNGMLVVSAAAGSGKTAVLIERVAQIITNEEKRVDADKLLIVTFTKTAAAELKYKLNVEIRKRLSVSPNNMYLVNQQIKLQKATICTIDSFLSSVVKEYFYLLGINREFRIAEESEVQIIKEDAFEFTLDNYYAELDDDFKFIIDNFCNDRDDKYLKECVFKIHNFLSQYPFRKKWLDSKASLFDVDDIDNSIWFTDIVIPYLYEVTNYLSRLVLSIDDILKIADLPIVDKLTPFINYYDDYTKGLNDVIKSGEYQKIVEYINSFTKKRFPTISGYTNDICKLNIQAIVKEYNGVYEKGLGNAIFTGSKEQHIRDIHHLGRLANKLFEIVEKFDEQYSSIKENKNIAEFSDLSRWMIKLLYTEDGNELTETALEIRKRYDYILVDEYQDSNEIQDCIFKAVSRGEDDDNLFVVGDVKQCIYAFREAKPDIFVNRRDSSTRYVGEEIYPASVILDKNFRSNKNILDFVNFIFREIMTKSIGGIDYDEDEELVVNDDREQLIDPVIEFDYVKFESDAITQEETEAKFLASKIKSILDSKLQIQDKNSLGNKITRDIKLSDMAILVRTDNGYSVNLIKELSKYGISAYSEKSDKFLTTQEIQVIVNLLKVIDNPNLDIELMTVLMSPIYGFNSDDLARIRSNKIKKSMSLYTGLKFDAMAKNEKSKFFIDELEFYREKSITSSIVDLINIIYDRTSYEYILSALSNSTQPKANLRMFSIYARDYENQTHKGLQAFLSYINRTLAMNKDLIAAKDMNASNDDSIVIMTIHKSKGLEWPVVFLANTTKNLLKDDKEQLLLDSDYGFAIKRKDIEKNAVFDTFPRKALAMKKLDIQMSEFVRVLYVALTRAKEQLYMSITLPKKYSKDGEEETMTKYIKGLSLKVIGEGKVSPYSVRSVNSVSDILTMMALIHRDGEVLRNYSDFEIDTRLDTDSSLSINVLDFDEIDFKLEKETCEEKEMIEPNNEITEFLSQRKAFEYKYKEILDVQSKVTVTELAHKESEFDFDTILRRPAIMQKEKLTGADKGTAFHMLAQYVDYKAAREDLEKEISRLVSNGSISEIQAKSIDRDKAKQFFESELVSRVIDAERVEREYRFVIHIRPSMVNKNIPPEYGNQMILLSGSVDLAFWENGEIVIVDYKTDKVNDIEELCEKYQYQVKYYEKALKDVTGDNVKQCYIYSVHLGQCKEIKYIE